MRVVPARFLQHAHHWLILHGRYVCKARKPACFACVIADLCPYEPKTLAVETDSRSRRGGSSGRAVGLSRRLTNRI